MKTQKPITDYFKPKVTIRYTTSRKTLKMLLDKVAGFSPGHCEKVRVLEGPKKYRYSLLVGRLYNNQPFAVPYSTSEGKRVGKFKAPKPIGGGTTSNVYSSKIYFKAEDGKRKKKDVAFLKAKTKDTSFARKHAVLQDLHRKERLKYVEPLGIHPQCERAIYITKLYESNLYNPTSFEGKTSEKFIEVLQGFIETYKNFYIPTDVKFSNVLVNKTESALCDLGEAVYVPPENASGWENDFILKNNWVYIGENPLITHTPELSLYSMIDLGKTIRDINGRILSGYEITSEEKTALFDRFKRENSAQLAISFLSIVLPNFWNNLNYLNVLESDYWDKELIYHYREFKIEKKEELFNALVIIGLDKDRINLLISCLDADPSKRPLPEDLLEIFLRVNK